MLTECYAYLMDTNMLPHVISEFLRQAICQVCRSVVNVLYQYLD
jgi:hypothetical protein